MIFKILQALSFGLPTVSSTIGNEGIMARNEEEILIADQPEDFVNQIVRVVKDRQLWDRISASGRRFVNSRYGWDHVMDEYLRNVE